jgi:hypothetical protein
VNDRLVTGLAAWGFTTLALRPLGGRFTDVLPPGVLDEIRSVNAVRSAACSVFRVTRNAVESVRGLTRSSTRSAPLSANTGASG